MVAQNSKVNLGTLSPTEMVPLARLRPATINDVIYKPVLPDDPAIVDLANSIRDFGLKEPIVATLDDVILSGHRRGKACEVAGLTEVPIRREPILSTDPTFPQLLVTYNKSRDKDPAERIREALVLTDPNDAHAELVSQRKRSTHVKVTPVALNEFRGRKKITKAKQPLLNAIREVIEELKEYWPLSDRRIHYALLNKPPLIHASKKNSRYKSAVVPFIYAVPMTLTYLAAAIACGAVSGAKYNASVVATFPLPVIAKEKS